MWRLRRSLPAACQSRGLVTDASAALIREFGGARAAPQVVPFDFGPEEAKARFLRWQRTNKLAPGSLLREGTASLRPLLLPFWLFSAAVEVEYSGLVGAPSRDGGPLAWCEVGWAPAAGVREHPSSLPGMQAPASFAYRRDYLDVVRGKHLLPRLQPLARGDAERGAAAVGPGGAAVPLDPPLVRQALAWEFALRAIRSREMADAEAALHAREGVQGVKDVHLRVHALFRSARLAYFPAFELRYTHGETFNVHGERVPEEFLAVIGGTEEGGVAAERHYSAPRAAAAVGGSLALGALGASAVLAPLVGFDPWSLVSLESAFLSFVACSSAGLGARMVPTLARQAEEGRQVAEVDAEFERVVGMGLSPLDPGTPEQEALRSGAEWRRWEESERREWSEPKRRRWAEELWLGQLRRRAERVRVAERLAAERVRQAAEDKREERRRKRWGHSSHFHHHHHHAQHQREGHGFAGGRRAGGRLDHLGYYGLLGLEKAGSAATQEDIKRAFRRAALRWHPDKHHGVRDEAAVRQARERYASLRAAYDVLGDPERRKAYDTGQPLP